MHFINSVLKKENILLVSVFLIFWAYFIFGGHLIFDMDIHSEFIPLKTLWAENVKKGIYPFWNPYSALGYPVHAGGHMGGLYPLNVIFLLFDHVYVATTYYFLVHIFMAYIGMYIFLKKYSSDFFYRLYGAMAFSFSGYVIANSSNLYYVSAICYFPLVIFFTNRLKAQLSFKNSIFLSLALAMQFLTGAFPIAFITTVSLLLYYYTSIFCYKIFFKRSKYIFLAGLLTILLTLPQLIPTLKYLQKTKLSQGVDVAYMINNSLNAELLSSYFFPHIWGVTNINNMNFQSDGYDSSQGFFDYDELHNYLGFSTLVLIVVAFLSWKKLFQEQKDILVLLGISFILSLGFLPLYEVLQRVPIFNFFKDPSKWGFVTTFCLSIVSVYGLSKITYKNALISVFLILTFVCLLSLKLNLWSNLLEYIEYPNCSQRNTANISCLIMSRIQPLHYFLMLLFIFLIFMFKFKFIKYSLLFILFFDLYLAELSALPAEKITYFESPFENYEALIADQPYYRGISGNFEDKEALNYQTLNSETGVIKKIHSLSTSSPLVSKEFVKIYDYAGAHGVTLEMSHAVKGDDLKWQNNFLNYNGVKYIIEKKGNDFYLEYRKNPVKRIFFADQVHTSKAPINDFLDSCSSTQCATFVSSSEYDRNQIAYESIGKNSENILRLKEYSVNHLSFDVENKSSVFIVYTDQNMDGWSVSVNGIQKEIVTVNEFYKGILIKEQGNYQIIFSYITPKFKTYLFISLLSFFLLAIYLKMKKHNL